MDMGKGSSQLRVGTYGARFVTSFLITFVLTTVPVIDGVLFIHSSLTNP